MKGVQIYQLALVPWHIIEEAEVLCHVRMKRLYYVRVEGTDSAGKCSQKRGFNGWVGEKIRLSYVRLDRWEEWREVWLG